MEISQPAEQRNGDSIALTGTVRLRKYVQANKGMHEE